MLIFQIPPNYKPERSYIIKVIFEEFLGIETKIEIQNRRNTRIIQDNKELILEDVLFSTPEDKWLKPESLPKQPLTVWNIPKKLVLNCPLVSQKIPIIYGEKINNSDSFLTFHSSSIKLSIDILGSTFFLLSGYEETIKPDRDQFGRFPFSASLAFQEGFLDRPIVNEYVEVLWWCISQLWPGLKRKTHIFKMIPTHDVDLPFLCLGTFFDLLQRIGGDLIKRKTPLGAMSTIYNYYTAKFGIKKDPFDTFDWIMDNSERVGLRSAFYFMSSGKTKYDVYYPVEHPLIQGLLKRIMERGHEIGFHPSYEAGFNHVIWNNELQLLKKHCQGARIKGGRHHFLRIRLPLTWRFWANAGMEYDSSLAFPGHPGFRSGTCYEYPVFDVENRNTLVLRERPLIVMGRTVMDDRYMGLGTDEEAWNTISKLKERCKLFNGIFTLLWHNNRLIFPEEIDLFQRCFTL